MTKPQTSSRFDQRRATMIAIGCAAFAFGMVGAAYASVPLYRMFCQATGYGGTTQRADSAPSVVAEREVTVRFDANASPGVPWAFRPNERSVRIRLGDVRQTSFHFKNLSDRPVTAQATFNVTPDAAGIYFNKIACFCFTEQTLAPGEEKDMPIVFFVDPAMLETEELRGAPAITLSYTLFRDDDAPVAESAAPEAAPGAGKQKL